MPNDRRAELRAFLANPAGGSAAPEAAPLGPAQAGGDRRAQLLDFLKVSGQRGYAQQELPERPDDGRMDPERKAEALKRVRDRAAGQDLSFSNPDYNERIAAGVKKFADVSTFGHGDEAFGMAEGGIPSMLGDIGSGRFAGSYDRAKDAYVLRRDQAADERQALSEDHPISSGAGTVGAILAQLGPKAIVNGARAIPGAVSNLGKLSRGVATPSGALQAVFDVPEATLGAVRNVLSPRAIGAGVKVGTRGAGYGALAGSGTSNADLTKGEWDQYLNDVKQSAGRVGVASAVLGSGAKALEVTADEMGHLVPGQIMAQRIAQGTGAIVGGAMGGPVGAGLGAEGARQAVGAIFRVLRPGLGRFAKNPEEGERLLAQYRQLYEAAERVGPVAVAQLHSQLRQHDPVYRAATGSAEAPGQLPFDRHPEDQFLPDTRETGPQVPYAPEPAPKAPDAATYRDATFTPRGQAEFQIPSEDSPQPGPPDPRKEAARQRLHDVGGRFGWVVPDSMLRSVQAGAYEAGELGSFGHTDEIRGMLNSLPDQAGTLWKHARNFSASGMGDEMLGNYRNERDKSSDERELLAEENPISTRMGDIAALGPSLGLRNPAALARSAPELLEAGAAAGRQLLKNPGAVGKAITSRIVPTVREMATREGLDTAKRVGATGAAFGAAGGSGYSDADLTKGEFSKYYDDVFTGAASSGALAGVLGSAGSSALRVEEKSLRAARLDRFGKLAGKVLDWGKRNPETGRSPAADWVRKKFLGEAGEKLTDEQVQHWAMRAVEDPAQWVGRHAGGVAGMYSGAVLGGKLGVTAGAVVGGLPGALAGLVGGMGYGGYKGDQLGSIAGGAAAAIPLRVGARLWLNKIYPALQKARYALPPEVEEQLARHTDQMNEAFSTLGVGGMTALHQKLRAEDPGYRAATEPFEQLGPMTDAAGPERASEITKTLDSGRDHRERMAAGAVLSRKYPLLEPSIHKSASNRRMQQVDYKYPEQRPDDAITPREQWPQPQKPAREDYYKARPGETGEAYLARRATADDAFVPDAVMESTLPKRGDGSSYLDTPEKQRKAKSVLHQYMLGKIDEADARDRISTLSTGPRGRDRNLFGKLLAEVLDETGMAPLLGKPATVPTRSQPNPVRSNIKSKPDDTGELLRQMREERAALHGEWQRLQTTRKPKRKRAAKPKRSIRHRIERDADGNIAALIREEG